MKRKIFCFICVLITLPILGYHYLSAPRDSFNLECEYNFTMNIEDSCRLYTTSIVKFSAPDTISCLLSFAEICQGCKDPEPIGIYEDYYGFQEIETRDFPTEFYKYVFAKQTISLVIIHPADIDYSQILSRIKVQGICKKDYEGKAMRIHPALSHFSIRSDIIVLPVLNPNL